MMEVVNFPFATFEGAFNYFRERNPARCKPFDIYEPEKGQKPTESEYSAELRWSWCMKAVMDTLKDSSTIEKEVFKLYYMREAPDDWGSEQIAKHLSVSNYRVRKAREELRERLEWCFHRRGLIPLSRDFFRRE